MPSWRAIPQVCLVDELAHTNVAGSEREKRYEDVEVILDAGIDVVSTLNVQHLESLNDTVAAITGVRVRETIPDSVLDEADEVILIDLSPEGARARMQHGNVYPPEQAKQALEGFFRAGEPGGPARPGPATHDPGGRRAARRVHARDRAQDRPRRAGAGAGRRAARLRASLLRHAWRLAQGLDAELLIAYFEADEPDSERKELLRVLELAEDLNGRIVALEGTLSAAGVGAFLKAERVQHLVATQEPRKSFAGFVRRSLVDRAH